MFQNISPMNKNNRCQYQIGILIIYGIIMKIPANHLFKSSTLKGRLRNYNLTSLWITKKKGLQEAAQSKGREYTRWHGCTVYSNLLNNLRAAQSYTSSHPTNYRICRLLETEPVQNEPTFWETLKDLHIFMNDSMKSANDFPGKWTNHFKNNELTRIFVKRFFYSQGGWLVGYGAALSHSLIQECCKITDKL